MIFSENRYPLFGIMLERQLPSTAFPAGKARRLIALLENKIKHASGAAELGSCLTDTTREDRSRRAVRNLPLCWRPSVCDSNPRGILTRWCHTNLRVYFQFASSDCGALLSRPTEQPL